MKRVLIADDELHICNLIKCLIDWEAYGLEVAGFAHDGETAFQMCQELLPSFLITDIRMPGLNGLELMKKIAETLPDIKVIIVTGYSQFPYALQAIKYHVIDYLLKPVQKNELEAALTKGLELIKKESGLLQADSANLVSAQKIKDNLLMCMIKNKNDMDNRRQIFDVYRDQFYSNDKERGWQLIQINFVFRSGEDIAFIQNFLKTKMKAIMTEGIGTNAIEIITTLLGNDFYCLINGNMDYLEEKKYENYIKDKLIILNETIQKVNFVIGVSNIYADYHKIYDCIAQCEKCVLHKVYKGKDRIIYFEKVPQPIYDTQFFLNDTFRKNFANALKNEDIRKISVLLEELSVVLYNYSKRTDRKTVLGIYDILVEEFYLTIFGYSQNDEVIESKKEILQQGRYFYSVSGLFHYLGEIIGSEIQSISKKKEEQSIKPVKLAQRYIEKHYMDDITLEEIAKEVGWTATYLSSSFKKNTGKSVVDYLTYIRVQHAKELLLDTERSIGEVADIVGFHDAKYFATRFKKITGVSPNEYRGLFS